MSCREFDLLLSDRAAGALAPGDDGRLEAHLAACPACRLEADALAEAVDLARLLPLADAEVAALGGLEGRVRASFRRAELGRTRRRRAAAGLAAIAAAAAAVVLAPGVLGHRLRPVPAAAVAAWEAPDPGELWDETAALDPDEVAEGSPEAAALAAYDEVDPP